MDNKIFRIKWNMLIIIDIFIFALYWYLFSKEYHEFILSIGIMLIISWLYCLDKYYTVKKINGNEKGKVNN